MSTPTIQTARLLLTAADEGRIRAEIESVDRLAALLNVQVPASWPPEHNDADTLAYTLSQLEGHPERVGWSTWHFILREDPGAQPTLVGIGGFYAPPDDQLEVEFGYSLVEEYQGRGLGTEAVAGLSQWAFAQGVAAVRASTLPHLKPSIRVLEKNGFTFAGPGSEEGVIVYRKGRLP